MIILGKFFEKLFGRRKRKPIRHSRDRWGVPTVELLEERILLSAPHSDRFTKPITAAPSLTGWLAGQDGGSGVGVGGVSINGASAVLREGNSFHVTFKKDITVAATAQTFSFTFTDLPANTTNKGIKDAFEVSFLDANGKSLVPTVGPGQDAFFNETKSQTPVIAPGVTLANNTVTVSLAGLTPGSVGTVIFRLVNDDLDGDSTVTVSNIQLTAGGSIPAPAIQNATAISTAAIDFSLLSDVTPSFAPTYGRTAFDEKATLLSADLSVKDVGTYLINTPLIVGIRNITDPSVVVANRDGTMPDGTPYFDFSRYFAQRTVQPGTASGARTISFVDPHHSAFTYTLVVLGQLNHPPRFTSQPILSANPGQTYVYAATAADPDTGDTLHYTKLSGPSGLTINGTTGAVSWAPQGSDLGTQAVSLQVTDSHGATDTQSFTLAIVPAPPNRPPAFTSTPGVDAGVAAAFQGVDIPVGNTPVGVAVGDFTGSGKQTVVGANTIDQNLSLATGNGDGTFNSANTLGVGEPPPDPSQLFVMPRTLPMTFPNQQPDAGVTGVARGDFNGDGFLDVATTSTRNPLDNPGRTFWLSIMYGNGDGTFQAPVDIAQLPNSGVGILAKDLDGDGHLDVAVAIPDSQQVWIFKGDGHGHFASPLTFAVGGAGNQVQAADLNNDHHLDLVLVNSSQNTISVLYGNGDGSFQAPQTFAVGSSPSDVAIADVNNDGHPDLIVGSYSDTFITFLVNDGHGGFTRNDQGFSRHAHGFTGGGMRASGIYAANFTGHADGTIDLVVSNINDSSIDVLKNDGTGVFTEISSVGLSPQYPVQGSLARLFTENVAPDLNGDGKPDVVFGQWGRGSANVVTIGLSNGDGTFTIKEYLASAGPGIPNGTRSDTWPGSVVVGDFNNDGVQDLVIGGDNQFNPTRAGGVSLLLGTTPGSFASPQVYDLQRDVGDVTAYYNRLYGGKNSLAIADFNNDGVPDAVLLSDAVSFAPGKGDGTFGPAQFVLGSAGIRGIYSFGYKDIRVADFNHDGNLDIAFISTNNGPVVALGNGHGGFSLLQVMPPQTYPGVVAGIDAQNIQVADLNGDGHPDLIVRTWNYQSSTGNIDIWLWDANANGGTGGFTYLPDPNHTLYLGPTVNDGIGHEAGASLLVGDFRGHGAQDIVVHVGGNGNVGQPGSFPERLLYWKDKGTPQPATVDDLFEPAYDANPAAGPIGLDNQGHNDGLSTLAHTGNFAEMVAGDFNNDGKLDLAGTGAFATFILLGNGDGTFQASTRMNVGGYDLKTVDLDRDGRLDLVVSTTFNEPAILKGRGDGTFLAPQFFASTVVASEDVVVADINGDGRPDVLINDQGSEGINPSIIVYLQPLPGLQAVATGDVNGDHHNDIVSVNEANDRLKVLLGNGDNTFTRLHDTIVGRGPVALALGNLNGDTNLDAVTANELGNSISILTGNGDGTFSRTDLATGKKPSSVAIGDVTGDGNNDIVVTNEGDNTITIYQGDGHGHFTPLAPLAVGAQPDSVALADIFGNGKKDIVVANRGDNTVTILQDLGNGSFAAALSFFVGAGPASVAVGDINGDGKKDIVVADPSTNQVMLLLNQGGGKFAKPIPITDNKQPVSVELADVNGDGKLDIVTADAASDTAVVLINHFGIGAPYQYQATATDPDGDPVTFSLVSGPAGMAVSSGGLVTWFPTPDQIGPNSVTLQVADDHGNSATQTFVINVEQTVGNHPPAIVSQPTMSVVSTQTYSYPVRAVDADKDPLQYSLTTAPAGMTINSVTGQVNWDPRGSALTFNGGDRAFIPDSPALEPNNLTIEGWFKFDSTAGTQVLLQKSIGNAYYLAAYQLSYDGATHSLNGFIGNANNGGNVKEIVTSAAFTPTLGQWYHIAFTFDATAHAQTLFLDGSQVGTTANPDPIFYGIGKDSIVLGENGPDQRTGYFHGTMDELAIWSTPRTQAQIQADSNGKLAGNETGLAAYYPMDDGQGKMLVDHTANHNDGTLGDSGIGLRLPAWVAGMPPLGANPVTVRVDDGRGGFDTQSFTLTVSNAAPAGIGGIVFNDITGSPALAGWVVYLDQNQNGIRDPGEPSTTTDATGYYSFSGLTAGTYRVAVEGQAGWSPTTPVGGATTVTVAAGQSNARVDQYASSVIAFSSQYSSAPWSAAQALGSPNTFGYGDIDTSWAASSVNGGPEFLTLGYTTPVLADGVTVRETWGNGFVTQVDVLDTNNVLHTVWTGVDPSQPGAPVEYAVTFPRTSYLVKGVKVYVDGNHNLSTWEEIDSVQLHGLDPTQFHSFGEAAVTPISARTPSFVSTAIAYAQVGQGYRYRPTIGNPDGRPITFDLVVKPDGMTVDPSTGTIAWTPTTSEVGTAQIIERIKDDRGLVALQAFTIMVAPANTPPLIASTPPTPAIANLPYEYDIKAQDAEGGSLHYSLDAASVALGVTIDASAGVLRWTPTTGQIGATHRLAVTVTDPQGSASTQTFNLPVLASTAHAPPVISSSPRTQIGLGNTYYYAVKVSETDGDPLVFSLPTHPAGMTIDATGLLTWTVPAALGASAVTVGVSDGRGPAVTQSFTITVTTLNPITPPVYTSQPVTSATAGQIYAYNVQTTDLDPVRYSFDQAPPGMSINPITGTIRWIPTLDQLGANAAMVRAVDAQGATTTQSFTVTVLGAHVPPIITSTPPTVGSVNATYLYAVQVSAFGSASLAYSLPTKPAGMIIDSRTGLISWTPASGQTGSASITLMVSDGNGGSATQTFAIVVAAHAPNQPPTITSTPTLLATAGVTYTYQIQATDPDDAIEHYAFPVTPPTGMTVSASGLVTWTPAANQIGANAVTVAAFDAVGAAGLQSFTIQVLPVNHPPSINSTAVTLVTAGNLYAYDVAASDPDGDALKYALTAAPAGMTIDSLGRIRWQTSTEPNSAAPLVSAVSVQVSDPRGATFTQSFNVTLAPDTLKPQVAIVLSSNPVNIGGMELVRVVSTDNVGVTSVTFTFNGKPIALDAQGGAVLDTSTAGLFPLIATVTDAAGNTGTSTLTFRVINPAVTNSPTATIASPADGGTITNVANVIGTVQDANLLNYQLLFRRADLPESSFTQIASGTHNVNNGVLGSIDPTLMTDDAYVIRLIATNAGGRQTIVDENISVAGNLKLGNFQLAFRDMTINVGGIPITLMRTYDSLNASQTGDFGFGWSLAYRDANLRTSVQKSGLEDIGLYTPFQPNTRVYLTLPGGQREGFTFTPDVHGLLNLIYYTPRFTPDAGVTDQLTVPNAYLTLGQDGAFYTVANNTPYNPASPDFGGGYTLTPKDGTAYQIDGNTGLLNTITDRNSNTLTLTDAGIIATTGAEVTFKRDAQGRIVSATDLAGKSLLYGYSVAGDLIRVTDRDGNVTKLTYDVTHAHYLSSVVDPLGREGTRLVYNTRGQLVGQFDVAGHEITYSFDPGSSSETIRDRLGNPEILVYDTQGNVTAKTNALGNTIRSTYDANGNVLTETNALGQTTSHTFNSNGNVLSTTDPLGHTTFYTYNLTNNLESVTDPLGDTTRMKYDGAGDLLSITDPMGRVQNFSYDTAGNVISTSDGSGRTSTVAYDAAGNRTSVTDPLGAIVKMTYDSNGRMLTQLSGGNATKLSYSGEGQVTSYVTASQSEHFVYDAAGRLVGGGPAGTTNTINYTSNNQVASATVANGFPSYTDAYDANGNLITETDSFGHSTTYLYDAVNQLIQTTHPDNTVEKNQYDAAGHLVDYTDVRNGHTKYTYDTAGRLTQIIDPLGGVIIKTYDAAGRLVAVTDPDNRVTQYFYDDSNLQTTIVYPDGTKTVKSYDAAGRFVSMTDPDGNTVKYQYDLMGRVSAVTDANSATTQYTYNDAGNVTSVTDSNGNETQYQYDSLGRLLQTTYPNGNQAARTYSEDGSLLSVTRGGQTVAYGYDARGLQNSVTLPDGTQEKYTYTYDGQLATVTNAVGTTTFQYDAVTRLPTKVTEPDGRYVRYSYDGMGNRTLVATAGPGGTNELLTQYSYDALSRLVRMTDPNGGVTSYTYTLGGLLASLTRPDGTRSAYTYDPYGRVAAISETSSVGVTLASENYTRDAAGNITAEGQADGSRVTYAYDSDNRVTSERHFNSLGVLVGTVGYTYDFVGNLLSRTGMLGNATFLYNSNNQIVSGDGLTYAYDAAGNLNSTKDSAGNVTQYIFNALGELTKVTSPASGTTTFTYDYAGNKTSATDANGTTNYLVDRFDPSGLAQDLRDTNSVNATVRSYVIGVAPAEITEAGQTSYFHSDAIGSIRLLTNGVGAVVASYAYSAFGQTLQHTGSITSPLQFAGQQAAGPHGLYYMRARVYNPATGTFLSRDPLFGDPLIPATFHSYLYANNNPVNSRDPSGMIGDLAEEEIVLLQQAEDAREQIASYRQYANKFERGVAVLATLLGGIMTTATILDPVRTIKTSLEIWGAKAPVGVFRSLKTGIGMLGGTKVDITATLVPYAYIQGKFILVNAYYTPSAPPLNPSITVAPGFLWPGAPSPGLRAMLPVAYNVNEPTMSGIMVHEFTHAVLGTKDYGYRTAALLPNLAAPVGPGRVQNAAQALDNADTYRIFVEAIARSLIPGLQRLLTGT